MGVGYAWMDNEVRSFITMLERGMWDSTEITTIRDGIEDRKSQVLSGVAHAHSYWDTKLKEIDPLLRLRWEYLKGGYWVVDRWVEGMECWFPVAHWAKPLTNQLLDALIEGDMQRYGPERYLAMKRARAAKVCADNDKRSTNRVLAAVDSLSSHQIKNFIAVERAIQTGETILARGEDARLLNEFSKKSSSPAPPSGCSINPGGHPRVFKRNYKRIRERGIGG
jgi:hypothetical protein